jgi:prophage regulatory protein
MALYRGLFAFNQRRF